MPDLIMTARQQAERIVDIAHKSRFSAQTVLLLWMVQENIQDGGELAEQRILFLSNGLISEDQIKTVIKDYRFQIPEADRIVFMYRHRNLNNAMCEVLAEKLYRVFGMGLTGMPLHKSRRSSYKQWELGLKELTS